ncbi:MAG: radical SAM protein [Pseudomonadota bacterium]|nr:radical SAM protein [Pseudomonadota bacterium]
MRLEQPELEQRDDRPAAPLAAPEPLVALEGAYRPGALRFRPEDSPFDTLFADITHRCNMACRNCYIPVRDLPDLPVDWLYAILKRLPRRTRVRLVGAEPTMREDLPQIIAEVRRLGHLPIVLSNGLKLGRAAYVRTLREAGLGTVYLSLNGGLRDQLYEAIDGLACATRKLKALDNLLAARMHVTTGTILVRGLSEPHLAELLDYLFARGVRDIHLRSVGQVGNHLAGRAFSLDELEAELRSALGTRGRELELAGQDLSSRDFRLGRILIQLTQWPELGSLTRGRIAPDGYLEPFFESIVANEFQY